MPLDALPAAPLPALPQASSQRLVQLADQARAGKPEAQGQLHEACQMLEAHFVSWLMREMRETVGQDGLLPHGPTEETYEQLLDDAMARAIARRGGLGISRALEAQLLQRAAAPAAGAAQAPAATPEKEPAESP